MSMMKNRFVERKAKKEVKAVEFDGLMPWSPENGLMPWGTPAQREQANQDLVNHFSHR